MSILTGPDFYRPGTEPRYIGEAYQTRQGIVIAIPNGRGLDESHNCDDMGCGQWHVLLRLPMPEKLDNSEHKP